MTSGNINAEKKKQFSNINNDLLNHFLSKTELFKQISKEDIKNISLKCDTFKFSKGSVIFKMDERCKWLYVVYSGFVAEFVNYGSSVNIIVKTRRTHDYIGEMGMLAGNTYANTAVALEELTLIGIPKEIFLDIVWKNPSITKHIIKELISRLTNSVKKTISTMYLDAPGRLAFTIVSLSSDMKGHGGGIRITQNDLAASSGLARQTAAKIMSEWRGNGWINTSRGLVMVSDLDALLDVIVSSELR